MNYQTARGWLTEAERQFLYEQAATADYILNVGIEYGASLHCLREGNPDAFIVAIDIIGDDRLQGDVEAVVIRGDSGIYAQNWTTPLDLAFIDGDHSYHGVIRDCGFAEHVNVGGLLIFHDCYAWEGGEHQTCPEVNEAVCSWYDAHQEQWEELTAVDSMRVFRRVAND